MPGIRTTIASLLFCSALGAQTVWMPLERGNVWVYRTASPGTGPAIEVHVERVEEFGSRTYSLVEGIPEGDVWLRNADDGRFMMWDEMASVERVWLDTAAKEGETSPTGVGPCNPTSTVVSREAKYTGPLGEFNWALHIRYGKGGCTDAGVESDYLLPWIGIVSRTVQTIAGPRRYDLVYARLGTATVLSTPELSFSLSVDRHHLFANLMPPVTPQAAVPAVNVRMTLRNTTPTPLTLEFATGQEFEMVLWNEKGQQVWRWSDGKLFEQAFHEITFHKGERSFTETVRLGSGEQAAAQPLPAGRYVLECWITSTLGRTFTASVLLTLSHVY